jgi:branched-chain amino acid transport system substrate-binding protein
MAWIGLALLSSVALPPLALADETIKVGLLATLEGAFTVLGQDSVRGAELAFKEANYTAGGKKIEVIKGSSDASPDSAVKAARKLVEQDGVKILIGPLSGDEGLAVKDYAKTQPGVTFINGTSAAQDTTLRDPAPNFFRFTTDGAQWMAGLGEYAYKDKGYHTVVTVAEDYSFPYTQVFGFMADFCKAGGHVPKKFWVPIGNKDFSSVIAAIPDKVDAIYVALGGADGVNFLTQYQQAGGTAPLIGGSITADQTVLSTQGKQRDSVMGMPSAGPIADNAEGMPGRSSSRITRPPSRTGSRRPHCSPTATMSKPRRCWPRSTRSRAISPTIRRSSARRSRRSKSIRPPARSSWTRIARRSPTST